MDSELVLPANSLDGSKLQDGREILELGCISLIS
jgi:hypothetical protein